MGRGVGLARFSVELGASGGSGEGTATGMETGAVSTTTGGVPPGAGIPVESAGEGVVAGAIGTAAFGGCATTGGILGALGRCGLDCVAAGTWASFLGDTGCNAVAAPRGRGAACAASARFSAAESAW